MSDAEPVAAGNYHLAVVRDLLLAAFDVQGLRNLFQYTTNPDLKPLDQRFSPNDGLTDMVDRTIGYCQKRDLLTALLQEVQRVNPRMYSQFEHNLEAPEVEAEPTDMMGDSITGPTVRKDLRRILVEILAAGLGAGLGLALCLMLSTLFVVRDITYLFRSVFLAPMGVALGVLALAGARVAVYLLRSQGEGLKAVGRIAGFWLGFVLALVVFWLPLESYAQSISPLSSGKNLFQTYVVGGSLWALGIIVGRELVAEFRPALVPWQVLLGGGVGGLVGCVLAALLGITVPLVEPSGSMAIKVAEAGLAGFGLGAGLAGGWALGVRSRGEPPGRQ